jgi:hypothetical protein
MGIIPLDVQRRCEQRWAARFSRPTEPASPQNQRSQSVGEPMAGLDTAEKNALTDAASIPLSKM